MSKSGYLSLELVVGEDTYWLTTGLERAGFYFTRLPRSFFGNRFLNPWLLTRNKDYSEITVDSEKGNIFKASQTGPEEILTIDVMTAVRLSWNDVAMNLIDLIPLEDQTGLWHGHVVEKTDPLLQIKEVAYMVTAFLPSQGIFAIRGEDYKLPENPNWITFNCENEEQFKARLKQFKIVAIHANDNYYSA